MNEFGIFQLLMGRDRNSSQGADFVLRKLFELENKSVIRTALDVFAT